MFYPHLPHALALLVSLTAILARPVAADSPAPPAEAVHAHFVVLGPAGGETVAYARAVLEPGYTCPTVVGGKSPVAMTTRDNPHAFPVIVCEARIGFGQTLGLRLADSEAALPTVSRDPERVLVFGDTGCKARKTGSDEGCAVGEPAEPFAMLATAAARGPKPDLILHVGDYNYRGTPGPILFTQKVDGVPSQVSEWPYDAGDGSTADEACEQSPGAGYWSQNAPNANYPDNWQAWKDDFFSAASDLLPAAPWIFSRGNHELCSRAGPGFFYFLDPHSNLGDGQLSCPEPNPSASALANEVLTEPYAVDLGSLRVVALDSANACDAFTNPRFTARYTEQLARVGALAPEGSNTWMISHRPIWGVDGFEEGQSTGCTAADAWSCINQTLQLALERGLGGAFPASVKLLLAGHMHRFEALTFPGTSRPPLLVVGNGGVALESFPPDGTLEVPVDGEGASVLATSDAVTTPQGSKSAWAYLEVNLAEDGAWQGTLRNPPERLLLGTCSSEAAARGQVCELAPGVQATPPP